MERTAKRKKVHGGIALYRVQGSEGSWHKLWDPWEAEDLEEKSVASPAKAVQQSSSERKEFSFGT